jgi:hypothetical protein
MSRPYSSSIEQLEEASVNRLAGPNRYRCPRVSTRARRRVRPPDDMQENAAKIRAKLVGEMDRSDVQNLESECIPD